MPHIFMKIQKYFLVTRVLDGWIKWNPLAPFCLWVGFQVARRTIQDTRIIYEPSLNIVRISGNICGFSAIYVNIAMHRHWKKGVGIFSKISSIFVS